jgi:hypothetical protein
MSLPVARCGFTVMMLKPSNSPHSGRVLLSLAPGEHNNFILFPKLKLPLKE